MGLFKAAAEAFGSTLGDQWEDYITCDSMDNNTLVVKKTTKTGQISSKSRIQVNPGQVAIIFDSGKILDATAEEGIYTFDSSSSPTLFAGQFGDVFKEAIQRFTYNGTAAKEQAIYYVNVKEILENRYGSATPVPYDDPVYRGIYIRFYGSYTFKISNPLVFFQNVVGNVASVYTKEALLEQSNSEFLTAIVTAFGRCAQDGVKYNCLNVHQDEIAKYMNDALDESWRQLRGMEVVKVSVESVTPDEESRQRIQKFDNAAMYSQQEFAAGRMVEATAAAMENAASNANGAATGFMGLGMMNMTANNMMGGQSPLQYVTPAQQPAQPAPQTAPVTPVVGAAVTPAPETPATTETVPTTEVAPETAAADPATTDPAVTPAPQPAADVKHCANCGMEVTGKFCSNCGTAVADVAAPKVCPTCGTAQDDGAKFCGKCGTALN